MTRWTTFGPAGSSLNSDLPLQLCNHDLIHLDPMHSGTPSDSNSRLQGGASNYDPNSWHGGLVDTGRAGVPQTAKSH